MSVLFLFAQATTDVSSGYPIFFFLLSSFSAIGVWLLFRKREISLRLNNQQLTQAKREGETYLISQHERLREHMQSQVQDYLQKNEFELNQICSQLAAKTEECQILNQDKAKIISEKRALEDHKHKNPISKKQVFNAAIIGIQHSGKTALLLRLIDPLVTNIDHFVQSGADDIYDRLVTVVENPGDSLRIEYLFRLHEWGGEHLVAAQRDMLKLCQRDVSIEKDGVIDLAGIQAIIFSVDLGDFTRDQTGKPIGPQIFQPSRIKEQVDDYFSGHKLPFLLNDTVLSRCRVVILFINKVDLLDGNLSENGKKAERLYEKLILDLRHACGKTPVEVIVGSAESDIGLTKLYSALVRGIIPENARRGNLGKAEQKRLPPAKKPSPVPEAPHNPPPVPTAPLVATPPSSHKKPS
jgi:hypothetical protein